MAWSPSFLVIEDDPMYRTLYVRSLQRLFPDARIVQTCDGAEAKARLADEHFDLAVMDLNMPVLDGAQLLEQIKRDRRHRNLVVIVISAFDTLAQDVHLSHYPNVFTFTKPLRAAELQQVLLQCASLAAESQQVLLQCASLTAQHHAREDAARKLTPDIVDRGHIDMYVGTDVELQSAVTGQFVLGAPNLLERLQRAVAANDFTVVAELAHDAHATTTIIGAHHAAKLAHRLLMSAKRKDRAECDTLCQQLSAEVMAYANALSAIPGETRQYVH